MGALIVGQGGVFIIGSACSFLSSGEFDMEGDALTFESGDAFVDGEFVSSGTVFVEGVVQFYGTVLMAGPVEIVHEGAILKLDGDSVLSGGTTNSGTLAVASTAEVLVAGFYSGSGVLTNNGSCESFDSC